MKSRISMWVAFKLPDFVVYYCGMRILAHATSGQWSDTGIPSLSIMDALERWGQSKGNAALDDEEKISEPTPPPNGPN